MNVSEAVHSQGKCSALKPVAVLLINMWRLRKEPFAVLSDS